MGQVTDHPRRFLGRGVGAVTPAERDAARAAVLSRAYHEGYRDGLADGMKRRPALTIAVRTWPQSIVFGLGACAGVIVTVLILAGLGAFQ